MDLLSSLNHRDESTNTAPDYVNTIALMNAAGIADLLKSAPIGWRLLGFRANRAGAAKDINETMESVKEATRK